jgi:hypothetical protein
MVFNPFCCGAHHRQALQRRKPDLEIKCLATKKYCCRITFQTTRSDFSGERRLAKTAGFMLACHFSALSLCSFFAPTE